MSFFLEKTIRGTEGTASEVMKSAVCYQLKLTIAAEIKEGNFMDTFIKRNRRWGAWMAILLIFVFIITGCGEKPVGSSESAEAEEKKVVRIGYQKGNTLNILKVKGNLEERLKEKGISVEWKLFAGGNLVMEALSAGSIDYGHAADGSGVFAQAGDQPFVYVGSDLPNPEGIGIMARKDAGIRTLKDLKGKTLGVGKGGNHHYLAVLAIERAGLKLEDVKWVYPKDASQMRAMFETKQVDALGSWDPFFATIQADLQPITLTDGKGYTPNPTFYMANKTFAAEHPDLIKIILEETDKSDQWANKNKPDVVQLLSETLGIDRKAIEIAVNRRTYGVRKIDTETIKAQQQLADTYHRIGLIDRAINVGDLMPQDAPWTPNLAKK